MGYFDFPEFWTCLCGLRRHKKPQETSWIIRGRILQPRMHNSRGCDDMFWPLKRLSLSCCHDRYHNQETHTCLASSRNAGKAREKKNRCAYRRRATGTHCTSIHCRRELRCGVSFATCGDCVGDLNCMIKHMMKHLLRPMRIIISIGTDEHQGDMTTVIISPPASPPAEELTTPEPETTVVARLSADTC